MDVNESRALAARQHLLACYPFLRHPFGRLGTVSLACTEEVPITKAVTRIVIGQMLSRAAACSIYRRVESSVEGLGYAHAWDLPDEGLVAAGLSRRKVRTLKEFGGLYAADQKRIEAWRYLLFPDLLEEVRAIWGMSDWTAAMLAIFHFRIEDVFPDTDGTLKRCVALVKALSGGSEFDPHVCSPFRSYLALYLWRALDDGVLPGGQGD